LLPWRPRHLVADLEAALCRDEHLDHLDHARRELVTGLQALELGSVMTLHASTFAFMAAIAFPASSCTEIFSTRTWPHTGRAAALRAPRRFRVALFEHSLRSSDITRPASFFRRETFSACESFLPG